MIAQSPLFSQDFKFPNVHVALLNHIYYWTMFQIPVIWLLRIYAKITHSQSDLQYQRVSSLNVLSSHLSSAEPQVHFRLLLWITSLTLTVLVIHYIRVALAWRAKKTPSEQSCLWNEGYKLVSEVLAHLQVAECLVFCVPKTTVTMFSDTQHTRAMTHL